MRIWSNIKKVFFLKSVTPYISWFNRVITLPASVAFNTLRALTDVLGALAFAKAIELIAIKDNDYEILDLALSPRNMLYISAAFYAYSRFSPYLIRIMVVPARKEMTKNLKKSILEKTYALSYLQIRGNKDILDQALQYSREINELVAIVPSNIHQPLISFITGSDFFVYVVLKTFSGVSVYELLGTTDLIRQANNLFTQFISRYKETILNYEVVKIFHKTDLESTIAKEFLDEYLTPYSASVSREAWAYLSSCVLPTFADFGVISYIAFNGDIALEIKELIFLLNFLSIINANSTRFLEACYRAFRLQTSYEEIKKVLSLSDEDHSQEQIDDE
jgi:hypothetical protein